MFRSFLILSCFFLPGLVRAEPPSFLNDIQPLLTRLGCNQGACHGKGAGQNGFRLSLRGYAPEWDYFWLTREFAGRRINPALPAESLLLQKPLGLAPHEGGKLLIPGSREYQVLLDWIQAGCPGPNSNDPEVRRVVVTPDRKLLKPGQTLQLEVKAEYTDGQTRDVTWLAKFDTGDASVAEVSPEGLATMIRTGETALRANFMGQVAVVLVTAPHEQPAAPEKFQHQNNFIDQHVFQKLAELHIEPSPLCSDDVFLRRVFLDTLGILPSPQEVRDFLADQDPDKRQRLIDRVLDRPEFVDFWTWWLGDLLQNRKEADHDVRGTQGVRAFHEWIRGQVARNRPWDEMVRELLTVTGGTHDHPAVGYFIVTVGEQREAHKSTVVASVAQTFLGTRIGCAQCHNHPSEKYTQDDYYHFAGFFSRIKLQRQDPKKGPTNLLVSHADIKQNMKPIGVTQPRTGKFLAPRPLDRSAVDLKREDDPRKLLAEWMTDPGNEYFASAMVNRLWAHFLGVGLATPIDDLRASNPPSNPALWKALCAEFVRSGFNRKHLIRLILQSRTYQLASTTNPSNEKDNRFYSHYYARRLPAEVFLDAISHVAGVPERFEGYPDGLRALQIPDPAAKSYFLSIFGRSERITACACERNNEVTLPQMLHLYGSAPLEQKLTHKEGRLRQLAQSKRTDQELIEEVFLLALSRFPTGAERETCEKLFQQKEANEMREQILRDVFWAVINSNTFAFNH